MTTGDRWQLPDGIDELLPAPAARLEALRRRLLDLHRCWGYQLVMPPLVEFTESLLIGLGADIDRLTFRLTDQLSGRNMGVRADITPQVARIDAHSLAGNGVNRFCYAGSVLHTRPTTLLGSRSPVKLGAEIYGDASLAADLEVISLMLETLRAAGIEGVTLDLGHVGIASGLLAELDDALRDPVYEALQRKSRPDLEQLLKGVDAKLAGRVMELASLHGGVEVLDRVPAGHAAVDEAIAELRQVAAAIAERYPAVEVYFDLAELRGYRYHTGLVFAAYVAEQGRALANGGRYDDVGEVFGRPRPATGFSTDLLVLLELAAADQPPEAGAIAAPADSDAALWQTVKSLRAAGEIVINDVSTSRDPRCDRQLVLRDGEWKVEELE